MIHGDGKILNPVCKVNSEKNVLQMSGFEFANMADYGLKDERYTSNLLPFCRHKVIAMMKKIGYVLGMGLSKEGK